MPRAGLTRSAVVEHAIALVDPDPRGIDSLTLAAVASRAGVAVPSLYKHIGSLGELRDAVALAGVVGATDRASEATIGVAGPEALRRLGIALRDYAREHPGLFAATRLVTTTDDEVLRRAGARTVEVIAAVLRGFGLPPEREVDAVRTVRAALTGFVTLESEGGFGLPDDVDRSFGALLDVLEAGMGVLGSR